MVEIAATAGEGFSFKLRRGGLVMVAHDDLGLLAVAPENSPFSC